MYVQRFNSFITNINLIRSLSLLSHPTYLTSLSYSFLPSSSLSFSLIVFSLFTCVRRYVFQELNYISFSSCPFHCPLYLFSMCLPPFSPSLLRNLSLSLFHTCICFHSIFSFFLPLSLFFQFPIHDCYPYPLSFAILSCCKDNN
jgi:hypothetical protein